MKAMTADYMKKRISEMYPYYFEYNGLNCGVDPLSETEIDIWYGQEILHTAKSVDEAMSMPIFDGKSFAEICHKVDYF